MDIDVSKVKLEKKTLNRGVRWKPTVLEMLRYISNHKGVSIPQELENYIVKEYKKIIKKNEKEKLQNG